ncbi:MAG: hypothetical protein ACRD59_06190 [Candidatus Acidiferrales bacterium]
MRLLAFTRNPARTKLVVALFLAAFIYFAAPTPGCGPFLPDAIFTYSLHPDFPLVNFTRGDLGIIQSSYARSYLVVAYRNLAGTPLTDKEQQGALNLWQDRLTSGWQPGQSSEQPETKIQEWLKARGTVPGIAAIDLNAGDPMGIPRSASQPYQSYYNCLPDAFVTAISTLEGLVAKFGAASPEAKSWLTAQDQVFANCSDHPESTAVIIPIAAKPDDNPLIRDDRAYQIAAAYFYGEDFPKAEEQFAQIAHDKSSPYSKIAPLLLARTYIREATLGDQPSGFNYAPMAKAETQLKSILADKILAEIHPAAQRLLGFVEFRLHPRERLLALSADLSQKGGSSDFEQDLWDYTMLLDKWSSLASDPPASGASKDPPADPEKSLADLRSASDLTDWVLTISEPGEPAANHALERWKHQHSIPWLVAAISTISPKDPQAAALAAAAANTSSDSAAFATIAFHRARILTGSNQQDAARTELDAVLANSAANFPPSSLNLILAQRFNLARNFDEFLRYAPREASGIVTFTGELELPEDSDSVFSMDPNDYQPAPQPPLFDSDSVRLFNRQVPLELLKRAANSNALPENLRAQIAQIAWVRSVLLDDDSAAQSLATVVAAQTPALKSDLAGFLAEKTNEARRFAALVTILRNPGLRPNTTAGVLRSEALNEINQYRDNWWCPAGESEETQGAEADEDETIVKRSVWMPALSAALEELDSPTRVAAPSFLAATDKKAATADWRRLVAVGAAPDYLTRSVLDWANSNPTDDRVPEALYLAVRSTRFGCTTPDTAKLSKQAFELLHKKYPNTPWAGKTKYWYGAD